jgi:hypothetical protein
MSASNIMPIAADLPTWCDGETLLTEAEKLKEWRYRYHERLGMLCGGNPPTPAQDILARDEADAAVEMMSRKKQ